jgi:hypothetical protein
MKRIKVVCDQPFRAFNQSGELVGEVGYCEEFVASLHEESEEYFALDSDGREIYVGCLNMNGSLELDENFSLVEEGADTE